MQIRTPKKYQGVQRRSVIGCRRILFYLVMIALIAAGIGIYLNQQTLAPIVQEALIDAIGDLEDRAATMAVPAPMPTIDPSGKIIEANNYWTQGRAERSVGCLSRNRRFAAQLGRDLPPHRRRSNQPGKAIRSALLCRARHQCRSVFRRCLGHTSLGTGLGRTGLARRSRAPCTPWNSIPKAAERGPIWPKPILAWGKHNGRRARWEGVLEEDPDSAEAYRARGLIKWLGFNDYPGAVQDFPERLFHRGKHGLCRRGHRLYRERGLGQS